MKQNVNVLVLVCAALGVAPGAAGCAAERERGDGIGPDGGGSTAGALEVEGTWVSNFDSMEVITNDSWGYMEVVSFDNEENIAITQNAGDDMFNPDKFNRVHWTDVDGATFHYCVAVFGIDTAEQAALEPAKVDEGDLDGAGCGGFPWTELTRK
jgi:hypothetical protein